MKRTLLTAAIALAAALSARAQDAVQTVEVRLDALGGDWVTSYCGETPDLTALSAGQALTFSWTDTTGLSDVEIQVRIHWRQHSGKACGVSLNGVSLGELDHPKVVFPCREGTSYPTGHLLRIPAGVYVANGLNEFVLTLMDDSGGAIAVCESRNAAYALSFEIRALSPLPQPDVDVQEEIASLAQLFGDWVAGNLGESADLSADTPGQVVKYSFTDKTGHASIQLQVEINWRHHRGRTCEAFLNGVSLGRLDQPLATLEILPHVFYPTAHNFRVPAGVYVANGLNEFSLKFVDEMGGAAEICEPPGQAVAMRFTIREAREVSMPAPKTDPVYPQGLVLIDLGTGLVFVPGMVIQSPNLQIMAILTDADGDYAAIELEIQRIDSAFTGRPILQSLPVASGGRVIVILPPLGPGMWQIQVRAIDQRGRTSDWVQVETVIEVADTASGRTYTGVDRTTIPPQPVERIVIRESGGSSSGGGCSAGQAPARGAVLMILAAFLLIGVGRKS